MQDATHQVPSLASTAYSSIAVALSSAQNVPLLLLTPLVNPKRPLLLLPLLPVLLRGVLKVAVAAAAAAVGRRRRRREGGGRREGERRRRREGKVRRQGQGRSEKKCWMLIFRIILSFIFFHLCTGCYCPALLRCCCRPCCCCRRRRRRRRPRTACGCRRTA